MLDGSETDWEFYDPGQIGIRGSRGFKEDEIARDREKIR